MRGDQSTENRLGSVQRFGIERWIAGTHLTRGHVLGSVGLQVSTSVLYLIGKKGIDLNDDQAGCTAVLVLLISLGVSACSEQASLRKEAMNMKPDQLRVTDTTRKKFLPNAVAKGWHILPNNGNALLQECNDGRLTRKRWRHVFRSSGRGWRASFRLHSLPSRVEGASMPALNSATSSRPIGRRSSDQGSARGTRAGAAAGLDRARYTSILTPMSATTAANSRRRVATGRAWARRAPRGARNALPATMAATAGQ